MNCGNCPQRYLVVFLGFIGLLISIGYRSVFAMVMVHVTSTGNSSTESIFPKCTNSSMDFHLDWDNKRVLLLHTAYFAGTIITQIPGGILATRFSSKRVCGFVLLLSSVLMLLLPICLKYRYSLVMVIRVVQGILEGCSVPALNGTISAWAPRDERSRLITLAYAGAYLSPALAMVTTGSTTCYVRWDIIFYIYGGIGICWSLVWLLIVKSTPSDHTSLGEKERRLFEQDGPGVQAGNRNIAGAIPWCSILRSLPLSAIVVGAFCRNWIFSMLITEQPQYFKDVFNLHAADIGLLSAIPHLLMTSVVIFGGVLVDTLIKKRYVTITVGRKLAQTVGFGVEGVCVLSLGFIGDTHYKVALTVLCVGVGLSGFAISGYQVNPLDLAPQYTSVLTGIARLGCCGAIISTLVAACSTNGHDKLEEWQDVFIIAGAIHLAGVVYYGIFASGNIQSWAEGHQPPQSVNNANETVEYDDENLGYDSERERLMGKSLPPGFYDPNSNDFGSSMRFLNSM